MRLYFPTIFLGSLMYKSLLLALCMVSAAILSSGCQSQPKAPEKEHLTSAEALERRQKILSMKELALEKLYAENPAAKAEIQSANGYAVFDINTVNALVVVGSKGKGLLTDNKTGKQTYMLTVRAGTGPGIGYQHLYQIFVFKSEAALAQFKVGDAAGGDVSAGATLGTANKQYSFNPYITVYQVSDKGFAVQANWGGTAYFVDPNLN
jgi:lipid-binding SYLF domain-containing protein